MLEANQQKQASKSGNIFWQKLDHHYPFNIVPKENTHISKHHSANCLGNLLKIELYIYPFKPSESY